MPTGGELSDRAAPVATLHGFRGPAGSALDAWLRACEATPSRMCTTAGPYTAAIHGVSVPAALDSAARQGLPPGPALPEAVTARLRRQRVAVAWGEPAREVDLAGWLAECAARGRHSVDVVRADPSLLSDLQVGAWWEASPAFRALRVLPGSPERWPQQALRRFSPAVLSDLAFWAGVRAVATGREWARLARSSYVVLCYHRVAGEAKPGQERMDIAPATFHRQLALLRLLGWRPLSPEQMARFHRGEDATLPRRRYVVTLDDAFLDAVVEAERAARHAPQVFAVTAEVGGRGGWLDGEPLAGWDHLARLVASGGVVGSHARHHVRLDSLADGDVDDEVIGSLADLRARLPVGVPLIAYPHGAHDERVRDSAVRAGYAAAYSSMHGRNGAGTDLFALRRIEPKAAEGFGVFAWKVLTGANRPPAYRRLALRATALMPRGPHRRSGTSAARKR